MSKEAKELAGFVDARPSVYGFVYRDVDCRSTACNRNTTAYGMTLALAASRVYKPSEFAL